MQYETTESTPRWSLKLDSQAFFTSFLARENFLILSNRESRWYNDKSLRNAVALRMYVTKSL